MIDVDRYSQVYCRYLIDMMLLSYDCKLLHHENLAYVQHAA